MFSIKQSISLDDKNLSLKKGDTYQLKYNSSNENLQWESNNTSVVTVDKNGKVKAVGVGTAIITVSIEDGYQATCKVSVTASIANCNINKLSTQTYTGGKIEPALTVKDEDKTLVKNKDYTVSYKNNVNVGTATAIIKGKGNYTGTANISFEIKKIILPTLVKLNASSKTILKGKTYTLVSTVTPSNATNKKVTYTTSNSKVATVTSTGTVKAVNYGTADITVKTSNGKTATSSIQSNILLWKESYIKKPNKERICLFRMV